MNRLDEVPEAASLPRRSGIGAGRDPLSSEAGVAAYWLVIRRHLWQILGLALAIGMLAGLFAYSLEPVYESTTTLLIDTNRRGFSPVQDDPAGGWYAYLSGQTYLQTQLLLLGSESLAENVAERLDLWDHPELDPRQEAPRRARLRLDLGAWLPDWSASDPAPGSDLDSAPDSSETPGIDAARRAVIRQLASSIQAEVIPDSEIIRLSFTSHDPELAAAAVAAYAEAYIELGLETRLETVRKAASWLTERLEGLKEQVDDSERELQRYRESSGLVDMEGAMDLTDRELEELSERLVEARARRDGLRGEYDQVRKLAEVDSASLSSHPVVVRSAIIQALKTEEVRAERETAELAERYGAQHPKMLAARSDLNTVRAKLRAEIDNTIAGIKKEFDIANARADQLEREFEQLKSRAQGVNRKEFTLRSLKRDVETNRQLYDTFLTRFKETDLGADVESTNARVVDAAQVPGQPIKPRKLRIILAGVLLALMLGIALAFLEEHLDSTLKGVEDVEHHTQLPTLGTVPLLDRRTRRRLAPERVFSENPKSEFAEAIRTIRTGVVLSGLDDPHRVVLVTSSVPGEGKTTLAINLAFALGQLERVLLIDADLRRSSIGAKLGLPGDAPGLSNLVAGTATLDESIHVMEGSGLNVLPAGQAPPNPLELLSSTRFARTLTDLEGRYDRIVIDSAPAQAVSDALVLSRLAHGVLFVIKSDETPRQLVQLAIRRLQRVEAHLVGAVLNQFDHDKASRYGHHHYGRYSRYASAYSGYSQYDRSPRQKA